ncbi:MAG: rod shape-determining protein RodA [Eubacteriales bacterium]|nr:rod shape-determining protein RodA [Eubacteriales bacterium]
MDKLWEKLKEAFLFIKTFDHIQILIPLCLSIIGLGVIYSATRSYETTKYVIVQGGAMLIGLVLMYFVVLLDYEYISAFWKYLFVVNIILMILVLIIGIGSEETGTTGWIRLGPIGFQPAELIKITFIITLASHIDSLKEDINYIGNVFKLLIHLAIPVTLILMQPDLGTAVVFIFIFFTMLFAAGLAGRYIATALGAALISAPLLYFFVLSDFQKKRILNFLFPEADPSGSGYQVIQSKIAVGSGEISGKGFMQGVQTQLGYLPEKHTDFIFAVIGEELGLIGCIFILILLTILIVRCFYLGSHAKNNTGMLICIGVGAMLLFHTLENIGMSIGIMPVTGIPLPFISYGGSSMLTCWLAIGLTVSVSIRRNTLRF